MHFSRNSAWASVVSNQLFYHWKQKLAPSTTVWYFQTVPLKWQACDRTFVWGQYSVSSLPFTHIDTKPCCLHSKYTFHQHTILFPVLLMWYEQLLFHAHRSALLSNPPLYLFLCFRQTKEENWDWWERQEWSASVEIAQEKFHITG